MSFPDLLIHPAAHSALQAMLSAPPHGLLLTGNQGIGKYTVASVWAQELTVGTAADIRTIAPDEKGTIGIDTVRGLYRESRGKHTGQQVIIIRDVDAMAAEAQNAFLKLLEEPPTGVTFILTTAQLHQMLPTIQSRVQHVHLHPLPVASLRQFALAQKPQISDQDLAQILFVAQGRPAIVASLLQDDALLQHHRERMQHAKALLSDAPHQRYTAINKLSASREICVATLEAMLAITSAQLFSAQGAARIRVIRISDQVQKTLQAIQQNGNLKAQLLALFSAY